MFADTRRLAAPLVLALFAAALGLRLAGTDHLLPHLAEPDAHVVEQVPMHRSGDPERWMASKAYGKYPHLLSRILQLLPEPRVPETPVRADRLEERLDAVSAPYRQGRRLVAVLSALLVPATWLLARRFLTRVGALLAAALVATSLLHLDFSWQARPHGPLATFTTAAALGLMHLARRPSVASYFLAGVASALAVACLQSGALVLPAGIAAHVLALRARGRGRSGRAGAHARLAIPIALVALAIALFYPFLARSLSLSDGGVEQAGHRFELASLDGTGFAALSRQLAGHDPVLGALAVLGAALGAAMLLRGSRPSPERRGDLLVALACALPYFVFLGLFAKTYERFQLPLLPYYAVLAAFAVERASAALAGSDGARRRALEVALSLAVLAVPAWLAVRLARIARAPDTGRLAARWIEEHVAQDERVLVLPDTSLPLLRDPTKLEPEVDPDSSRRRPWQHHLRLFGVEPGTPTRDVVTVPWRQYLLSGRVRLAKNDPRADELLSRVVRELDSDWALLEVRPGRAEVDGVPGAVAAAGELVTRVSPFGPGDDDGERPLLWRGHEDERLILRAWKAERFGPRYDVYHLHRQGRRDQQNQRESER